MVVEDRIVTVPVLELAGRDGYECMKVLLEAAATRMPTVFITRPVVELAIANADGVTLGVWDTEQWTWCKLELAKQTELNLLAFYVSFKNARGEILTVCVETAV